MKLLQINFQKIRPLRFLITAFACAMLFIMNTMPAFATATGNDPAHGVTPLKEIQKRSEDVLRRDPRSIEEVESDTEGGLNAVQGKADVEAMNRPSNSQGAVAVEEQIKEGLENVFGKSDK